MRLFTFLIVPILALLFPGKVTVLPASAIPSQLFRCSSPLSGCIPRRPSSRVRPGGVVSTKKTPVANVYRPTDPTTPKDSPEVKISLESEEFLKSSGLRTYKLLLDFTRAALELPGNDPKVLIGGSNAAETNAAENTQSNPAKTEICAKTETTRKPVKPELSAEARELKAIQDIKETAVKLNAIFSLGENSSAGSKAPAYSESEMEAKSEQLERLANYIKKKVIISSAHYASTRKNVLNMDSDEAVKTIFRMMDNALAAIRCMREAQADRKVESMFRRPGGVRHNDGIVEL